jgi:starch synthase
VPIVRRVGGLADTVRDAGDDQGNGFVFDHAQPLALQEAITRAFDLYRQRAAWSRLVQRGMGENLSWDGPAQQYMALYEQLGSARREPKQTSLD